LRIPCVDCSTIQAHAFGRRSFLLDAHISSIKAAVRSNIRDVDHPIAKTLLAELQTLVREYEA
jgi:hypothetical protein